MSNILDISVPESYSLGMRLSNELSHAVHTRRKEIGLTQKALAALAGLSRSTIIEIEKGTIKDLSLSRTATLLEVLGLGLHITPVHPKPEQQSTSTPPLEQLPRPSSAEMRVIR